MGKRTTLSLVYIWENVPLLTFFGFIFFFSKWLSKCNFVWFHRFYVFSLASSYFFSLTWAGVTLLTLLELSVVVLSGFYDMV